MEKKIVNLKKKKNVKFLIALGPKKKNFKLKHRLLGMKKKKFMQI